MSPRPDAALSRKKRRPWSTRFRAGKAPQSKLVDFSFQIVAKINGGHREGPRSSARARDARGSPSHGVQRATTAGQLALLRRWAREEALPILAATANGVDEKFGGVRGLGKTLDGLDTSKPLDVEKLTDHNSDYWQAMLEMIPGEPFIPMVRIALDVSNGEIDKARRLAEVAGAFDANKSGASRLLGEFRALMSLFYRAWRRGSGKESSFDRRKYAGRGSL